MQLLAPQLGRIFHFRPVFYTAADVYEAAEYAETAFKCPVVLLQARFPNQL
jgi:hypothetical protein